MQGRRFLFAAYGILSVFMGIMVYVTIHAFSRNSGSTGQDPAGIQKIRFESLKENR